MNGLLVATETLSALLEYAVYSVLIIVGLLSIASVRRKTKKEVTPEWVKNRCERAKAYASELLTDKKKSSVHEWLGSTRLLKLNDKLTDAVWAAYQLVEVKKDIVFEGLAQTLDKLADELNQETQNGYVSAEDFQKDVQTIIDGLNATIEKIEQRMESQAK